MKKLITLIFAIALFVSAANAQKIVSFGNDTLAGDTISFQYDKSAFTTYTSDGIVGFDFTIGTDTTTVHFQGSNGDVWNTLSTTLHEADTETSYHVIEDTISHVNYRLYVPSAASDADSGTITNVKFFKFE